MKDIPVRPVLVEEFLTGAEHSLDYAQWCSSLASFSRYYPSPLEVMQNPWIQCGPLSQGIDTPPLSKPETLGLRQKHLALRLR